MILISKELANSFQFLCEKAYINFSSAYAAVPYTLQYVLYSYFVAWNNTKYLKNTSYIKIAARIASFEEFILSDQCWVLL